METAEKKTILLVDDEPDWIEVSKARLKIAGYNVLTALGGIQALKILEREIPDLILLDIIMPDMDGIEVCKRIKSNRYISSIPIIFLSSKSDVSDKIRGLNEGVQDYIAKPVDNAELLARIEAVLKTNEHYKAISLRDKLTGLYNYTFFNEEFNHSFDMARRYNRVFSLIIIDIDNFKKLNDTYGHLCGNFVLQIVGERIKESMRRVDIVTRYAGDEFAVILPETNENQVTVVLARLKSMFDNMVLDYKGQNIAVSVSIGGTVYLPSIGTKEALFDVADKKMYSEKERKKTVTDS